MRRTGIFFVVKTMCTLKKLTILCLTIVLFARLSVKAQIGIAFSGDQTKFGEELTTFMGPNLTPEQTTNLNTFIHNLDSTYFSPENRTKIVDIASQFRKRSMRPVPNFNNFFSTINLFVANSLKEQTVTYWLKALGEILLDPGNSNDFIDKYVNNFGKTIVDNILYESLSGIVWKVTDSQLDFTYDTTFKVVVKEAVLVCYSQRDSTKILRVNGVYLPDRLLFMGSTGRVTFEKAGYSANEVYADIKDYNLDITRNSFILDSALLTHKTYFNEPVYGTLNDQATTFRNKENATYPRFATYKKSFFIEDIYEDIDYEGGLSFEGASVKGKGDYTELATISMYRNDTLYIKITAEEYLFSQNRLASAETSMVLYLDKDSIFHNNLSFSYNPTTRQVNMFQANNPISKGPYFNSFHSMDMYFELLSWNMNESKIVMSKAIGAAQGRAEFESASFFNENNYLQLQGIDQYHPLVRLIRFAEWYYSETFPVEEFAKWLNKPVETVIGLCIDMANKGFLYYDRLLNMVTLKQKTHDYVNAFLKRQDYDAMRIQSVVGSSNDNATLNLNNYQITVNGVSGVNLSTAQNVYIRPYNNSLIIGKNRTIEFDGMVNAGLFTIYGHKFRFDYDTFKVDLSSIDSIKIAVETDILDPYGNPYIKDIENLIQLGSAEVFIDDPMNKSGQRKLGQYPIFNATSYSYIFYDKIAGLEGVYPKSEVYFRIDPFTYENIDHYKEEDMHLKGTFIADGIVEPIDQYLTIQEDNSLGFNMEIPEDGISLYNNKGVLYNNLTMSNKGLIGSGKLTHFTSTTTAKEFKLYPDSMITQATSLEIEENSMGQYPVVNAEEVSIKWTPAEDKFVAKNSVDKRFNMFDNGTLFDGLLTITPTGLSGSGQTNTQDSRIVSNLFNFSSRTIQADTSTYNLFSPSSTSFAFIADNASTNVNFDTGLASFRLNTDNSMVMFPDIQYLCTMSNFVYDMNSKVMEMEQKGESSFTLLAPQELLELTKDQYDEPTFFSTNVNNDTISFFSSKGRYYVDREIIEADNINYIPIADALIQPGDGKITINRRAKIEKIDNALVAINNKHIIHTATISIESTKKYSGSGIYDYVDEEGGIQQISFPEITVDTLRSSAQGYIAAAENFMLSPAFGFQGDVQLFSLNKDLTFTGAASVVHDCDIKSYSIKFKSAIDPKNVMIPVSDKPRDINDNLVFSGSYINIDSAHIYPAFLSAQKSWSDVGLVTPNGYMWYNKSKNSYLIASKEKLVDPSLPSNLIEFNKESCSIYGEGKINFGTNFDLVLTSQSGQFEQKIDSGKVTLRTMLAFDFYFSEGALTMMGDELKMIPTLKAVDIGSDFYRKGMINIFGEEIAAGISTDLGLYGSLRSIPKGFNYEIVLNDVNLYWDEYNSSFRSVGPIGIGFIGTQPMNVYVDGYIEIQRRRTGDMFDIYLKADNSTWYYFSYMRGNMMAQAGNNNFNLLISTEKLSKRKHPESTVRKPYSYMISVEDRLPRFIRRMEEVPVDPSSNILDGSM